MIARTYTGDELDAWQEWFEKLDDASPYHSPTYLDLLTGDFEYETEQPELFVYGEKDAFIYYPYIRRPLSDLSFSDEVVKRPSEYADIVSSWYYGGPVLSPGGDESLAAEFVDEFAEYCKDTNILAEFIRFDPNLRNHDDFARLDPTYNRQTVPVDLSRSKDAIWNDYESRNRRAIKQARESALTIDREPTETDTGKFHDIYSNAMEARDASEHYRFTEGFFEDILDTPLFSLVVARYDGVIVGGFIIAHDSTYSHHYLSASNPDYWEYRVNNLMYHEVVMCMHETGRKVFDFQGGRPGVFKFKKGFSPSRGEFHIGKRTHVPDVYERLVDAAEAAGIETDSGYFPAYRVEQSN